VNVEQLEERCLMSATIRGPQPGEVELFPTAIGTPNSVSGKSIVWDKLGPISASGGALAVSYDVTLGPNLAEGTQLVFQASGRGTAVHPQAADPSLPGPAFQLVNAPCATQTIVVSPIHVGIGLTLQAQPTGGVYPEVVTYTATVTNTGDFPLDPVNLFRDAGTRPLGGTPPFPVNLDRLEPGQSRVFTYKGLIDMGVELVPDARGKQLAAIQVTFSEQVDGQSALDLFNYSVWTPGKDKMFRTPDDAGIPLKSAVYDPTSFTVTLTPAKPMKLNQFVEIDVYDQITDLAGNRLDGDRDGQPGGGGGGYVSYAGLGTKLSYEDSDGDIVNLSLRGGGLMELTLGLDGKGENLRLIGTSSRSTLSGSVRKPRTGATPENGVTTLRSISGPGAFTNRLKPTQFLILDSLLAAGELSALPSLV
jgi:hypothetical protein